MFVNFSREDDRSDFVCLAHTLYVRACVRAPLAVHFHSVSRVLLHSCPLSLPYSDVRYRYFFPSPFPHLPSVISLLLPFPTNYSSQNVIPLIAFPFSASTFRLPNHYYLLLHLLRLLLHFILVLNTLFIFYFTFPFLFCLKLLI